MHAGLAKGFAMNGSGSILRRVQIAGYISWVTLGIPPEFRFWSTAAILCGQPMWTQTSMERAYLEL